MSDKKIYKKGTKIKLECESGIWPGCGQSEIITLDKDTTEKELYKMSHDFALESIEPNGWFEVLS